MVWSLLEDDTDGDKVYRGTLKESGMPFIDDILSWRVHGLDSWPCDQLTDAIDAWLRSEKVCEVRLSLADIDSKTLEEVVCLTIPRGLQAQIQNASPYSRIGFHQGDESSYRLSTFPFSSFQFSQQPHSSRPHKGTGPGREAWSGRRGGDRPQGGETSTGAIARDAFRPALSR